MRKVETPPEDKTEVVYSADGPSLQSLIERIFKGYVQSGGYLSDEGDTE